VQITTPLKRHRLARAAAQLFAAAALAHGGIAHAFGLNDAYEAALANDPTYQSARFDNQAGQENRALGRSGLLPNLSGNYSKSKNRADVTAPNFLGKMTETNPVYTSRGVGVTLRQTLFNLDAYARYKQGAAQSDYSSAVFEAQGQELVLRVTGAYFDALFAIDQVRLAQVARDMYLEQKKVNDRLFEKGEGTRTDMLETQARLELAEAQLIEAKDNELNARTALAGIVGRDVASLDALAPDWRSGKPPATGYADWEALALERNPEIQARTLALETARQEINKNRAGHAPRVDLVANYSKNEGETLNTFSQDSTARSIGFQINVPLYAGGYVNAATRQAVAGLEKAKADLQATKNKVLTDLRKQYSAATSGIARIAALEAAVASGKLLMKATEQSIKGGVRINLDLLNAQQQLYTSERDLAQARYNYLLTIMRLHADAGTLTVADVREVGAYFR
jgi:outer membrane protein, protease secretion system